MYSLIHKLKIFIPLLIIFWSTFSYSQTNKRVLFVGQDYLKPYLQDPSFIGERSNVEANAIVQASDSELRQTTQYFFAQLPYGNKIAFSADYFKDGFIFQTYSSVMLGAAITFGSSDNHLKIGVTGGLDRLSQDRFLIDELVDDENFLELINQSDNSFAYRAGLHYKFKNLTIGGFYSELPLQGLNSEIGLENVIQYELEEGYAAYLKYTFPVSDDYVITPMARYLSYDDIQIYEGGFLLDYKDRLQANVAYKNEYSINAAIQVLFFESLQIGYSYEKSLGDLNFADVHSIGLSYRFKSENGSNDPEWLETAKKNIKKTERIKKEKPKKEKSKEVLPEPVIEKENEKQSVEAKEEAETGALEKEYVKLSKGYSIIVGSFAKKDLAKEYKEKYKDLGYATNIAIKPENGRYLLVIDVYDNEKDAQKKLKIYASDKTFKNPWIYERK